MFYKILYCLWSRCWSYSYHSSFSSSSWISRTL